MTGANRAVGISVDVDSVGAHLRGYGVVDPPADDRAYRLAIPRVLGLLDSVGARATFFLIAEEAREQGDMVREIVAAGHEVGCHSMTHRLPFDLSDPTFVRREIRESRERLEALSGERVSGFRAPSWGVSDRLLKALAESGYRYDASSFPSWTRYLLRLMVMRRREGPRTGRLHAPIRQMFFVRPSPHVVSGRLGGLVEIPVSTIPLIRVPVYHTLAFLLPSRVFEALLAALRLRRGPLNYAFHAVDFLDLAEDGIDPRLRSHPGMDRPLGEKIDRARAALTALRQAGDLCSLQEMAGGVRVR